ncbi:hypothetical protein G9A89_005707 [Geosiphon pyriformis]|nr:hypothetical protein G9A89_005707 [Geosiphon pyriformis]
MKMVFSISRINTVLSVCLVFMFASVLARQTSIKVLYPSEKYYLVANSTINIVWSSNSTADDPKAFSIELEYPNEPSFAIANNVKTSLGEVTVLVQQVPPRKGYRLAFVNISNINDPYAVSELFEIKSLGTEVIKYEPPKESSSQSTINSSNSGNNTNSTASSATTLNVHTSRYAIVTTLALVVLGFFFCQL